MADNPNIPRLKAWYSEGKLQRRDFLRQSTLLGLSSAAAYSFVGLVAPDAMRAAASDLPMGGTLRMGMRVADITSPHNLAFNEHATLLRPACDHLVRTGTDNITRPALCSGWEVTEDLRSWDLSIRRGVMWHNGREFTAEDAAWNLRRLLAPETGSSIVGLMGSYMLTQVETGETDDDGNPVTRSELWDASAIEVIDPFTLRLNLKVAQGAVPEHLFHWPAFMLDPEDNGVFGIGANGTGAFRLVEYAIGERAVYERVDGQHFSGGPYLDRIEFTDLGEDPNAVLGALITQQVDGLYELSENQVPALEALPHITIYRATTGQTAISRGKVTQPPFDDPRVMRAMRLATNAENVVNLALRGFAEAGDHTLVSPVHPEWVDLGPFDYDPEGARALLAEAGHPDGVTLDFYVKTQPAWELDVAQVMVEDWAQGGFNVNIRTVPASLFWDNWLNYPFSLTGWGHRPLGMMVLALAFRTGVPWNEAEFSNAEFDELLTQIEGTIDPDERREIMGRLMAIMREEGPIVQPFFMQVTNAFNARVLGYEMHPVKVIFFDQLAVEQA